MKNLFLLSLAILMSVSLVAQQKKMVEFEQSVHDFGKVVEGEGNGGRITTVFKFTNTGTVPVFIERANASCGCTTPVVDSSKPIDPGAYGEIPVSYSTIGRPGTFSKSVTVFLKNATGETSIEKLIIKGEVLPRNDTSQPVVIDVQAQPEQVKDTSKKETIKQTKPDNKKNKKAKK